MPTKKKGKGKNINIPAAAQEYRGPSRVPLANLQEDMVTLEMSLVVPCTATGGGILNNTQAFSLSSMSQSSSVQALWDEYRVLAVEVLWIPQAEDVAQVPAEASAPLAIVIDRDSGNALTSLSQAMSFASAVVRCVHKRQKIVYKMSGSEDAQFLPSSTATPAWVKIYGGAFTIATLYGNLILRSVVQVRGRVA